MNAAFLQFNPEYLAVEANLDQVDAHLSDTDADLIVLPELFTSGYFFRSTQDAERIAEPIPNGRTTRRLVSWSAQTGATIVAGLAEREGDTLYNSAVVTDPSGVISHYRKVHLYYQETQHFATGDLGFPVVEAKTRSGVSYRLGVMVCFDWYFPEAARSLALQGADIIAHPSNLVRPDCPRAMPIRALENHVFTITANRYGHESNEGEELTFIGQSEICDPSGQILIRADKKGDTFGQVPVDPRAARDRQITDHNHLFNDRHPDAYRLS